MYAYRGTCTSRIALDSFGVTVLFVPMSNVQVSGYEGVGLGLREISAVGRVSGIIYISMCMGDEKWEGCVHVHVDVLHVGNQADIDNGQGWGGGIVVVGGRYWGGCFIPMYTGF